MAERRASPRVLARSSTAAMTSGAGVTSLPTRLVAFEEHADILALDVEHVAQRLEDLERDLDHVPGGQAVDRGAGDPSLEALGELVGGHVVLSEELGEAESHAPR